MATKIPGSIVPHEDEYFSGQRAPGVVFKRRTWKNDTSTDPRGVSPIKQDGDYFLSRLKPIFVTTAGETVYTETAPVPAKGSEIVSPSGDVDHGPPELQETVAIKLGEEMLIIREAVASIP